jgi:tRNA pseudouridine38-40 synthase
MPLRGSWHRRCSDAWADRGEDRWPACALTPGYWPMKFALGMEYDGSYFLGWQRQTTGLTVQAEIEGALSIVADEKISVICAGRTDRGVHGIEQVVHFETASERPVTAWVRGVNALLPDSVAVLWAKHVPESFHARYSATARTYRYVLLNRGVRPALQARYAGWFHRELDLGKMQRAAAFLIGTYDFSAFRSSECQAKTPVRCLTACEIVRNGDRFEFLLTANAFLHHMVRNIVGTLVYVGKGKHEPQWVRQVLESRERAMAAPTFSPEGLYLERVRYPEIWELPQVAGCNSVLMERKRAYSNQDMRHNERR